MKSKTIKGLSTQSLVTIIFGVIEILFFSIHSRLLCPKDFGYYALLTAITTIFLGISEAGLGASLVHKKDITDSFINTVFTMSFCLGVFFSVSLFFIAPYIASLVADSSVTLPLRLMSFCILIQCLNSCNRALFIKKLDFLGYGIRNIFAYVIGYSIGCIFAIFDFGVYTLVISFVLYNITLCLLLFLSTKQKTKFKIDRECFKQILNYSGWLTLGVILRIFYQQVDKIITPKLLSVSDLGKYNRPAGFVSKISTAISHIFDTTLFPILSKIQDDEYKIQYQYCKILYSINFLGIFLSVSFYAISELVFDIFLGSKWIDVLPIFRILSVTFIISLNNSILDCFIRSLALVKIGFYLRLFACFVTFFSVIFGAKFGIMGIAIGILISNCIITSTKFLYVTCKIRTGLFHTSIIIFNSYRIGFFPLSLSVLAIEYFRIGVFQSVGLFFINCIIMIIFMLKSPIVLGNNYNAYILPLVNSMTNKISQILKR